MDLMLGTSKAGHDKNHVYVIVGEADEFYFLANGETKKISNPKKKKKIHVQEIKRLSQEISEISDSLEELDDLSIKRILKVYNRRNKDV